MKFTPLVADKYVISYEASDRLGNKNVATIEADITVSSKPIIASILSAKTRATPSIHNSSPGTINFHFFTLKCLAILVFDLFYNTPARLKFLKNEKIVE